ncbi:MAG TPA: tripartite tricarboxylate transporter substrate binding protein [Lautropia sp.]|nr:tripartite tricarboxylate transporter substrate binding protein [Lautropia sp.]
MLLFAGPAVAQSVQSVLAPAYPIKTIRLVVPYPPGGATDVIGRVVAQKLAAEFGQQVVVDNRAGAAGSIGAGMVANGAADGHTLLMGALTSHSINAALYGKTVPFDIEKSFAPIAIVGTVPLIVVVHPDVKAATLAELIALAKASPGVITYASAGNGSPQHLAGELFQRLAGIRLLHVPYKGSGPALVDLVAGQVQTMIETAPAAQPHIRAGKLRALATTTTEPVPTLPDVPTAAKSGLEGFEVSSIFGVVAPAGTPDAVIAKLSAALKTIMAMPDVKETLLAQGALAGWTTVADAEAAIRDESAKWKKLIKEVGLQVE